MKMIFSNISLGIALMVALSGCLHYESTAEPPKCYPSEPGVADRAAYELWGKDRGLSLKGCRAICSAHIFVCNFSSSTGADVWAYCNGNRSCKMER